MQASKVVHVDIFWEAKFFEDAEIKTSSYMRFLGNVTPGLMKPHIYAVLYRETESIVNWINLDRKRKTEKL